MNFKTGNRNTGIDLLRVAFTFYIVSFIHGGLFKAIPIFEFITLKMTYIVLGTFVFISGYFIGLESKGSKNLEMNKKGIMPFYQKKLLRIYPLYVLSIILFTVFGMSSITTSIKAVFGISMIVKPAPLTLWFITMLMSFYLASPLLINACRKVHIGQLVLYCIFIILCLLIYNNFTQLLDIRVIMYFPSFFLGIFVAYEGHKSTPKKHLMIILLTGSIIVSFVNTNSGTVDILFNTPMVVLCSYLLFQISKNINVSSEIARKGIILLSYSSYCMYLFHRPIYKILDTLYSPETKLLQGVYVIFCLPCIIAISFIIQKLYDSTIDMLKNKSNGRKKVAPLI